MILVDTSVWHLSLRKPLRKPGPTDHPAVRRLTSDLRKDRDVALIGVILQEVLQAFRHEATARRLVDYFDGFPCLAIHRAEYIAAGKLHRRCRSHGISASTADCLIAAAAQAHRCPLLTTDADFERIATVCELDLVDYAGA